MPFCRNAQSLSNSDPRLWGPPGSVWAREAEDALRSTWNLKCFLMGIGLMGISYCVVLVSGVYERSLTLTVFTLLTFLFIYILWCRHQKQHLLNQNVSATNRTRSAVATISELVSPSSPSCPPQPFNVPDKRDTPPPSYQEAMLATAAVAVPVRNPVPPQIHSQLPAPPPPPPPLPPPPTPHFGIDMGTV